jgi:outer membrane protein assembly factor BamB
MSMKCRAAVVGLNVLALFAFVAWLQPGGAKAQVKMAVQAVAPAPPGAGPAAPGGDGEFTDAITLPKDREVKQRLEAARDYIAKEQWVEACRFLQRVLDRKEDVFVQVQRKGADKQDKVRWVSAKAESNRLIGDMKPKGLETYELEYGGLAKGQLADARKSGDPQLLAEIAQRYFHTQAGGEATDLLATYKLDRGEVLEAAQHYERLLQRHGADQLGPLTLAKAALAFRLAGANINQSRFQQVWKQLSDKISSDGLQIGDDNVSLAQLQKDLDQARPAETLGASDWAMFRGNISRSGIGRGSAPYLDSKWHRSTLEIDIAPDEPAKLSPATKSVIEQTLSQQARRPEPLLPGFLPIATGGKLLYRSYRAIHALNMQTGRLEWESDAVASLDFLIKDPNKKTDWTGWLQAYQQGSLQNIIFENTTTGTLSTDNARVYAVDDLGLPPHPNAVAGQQFGWPGGAGMQVSAGMSDLVNRNRLVALNLETGKIDWERGDPQHDNSDIAGSYFLGPPLPLAGKLYVLTEKNAELRLVCLEPSEGKPVWTQTLATVKDKLLNDVMRRVHAVNLAYAEGILVCPTNAGAVLGIDLLSRSLSWAFPYREKSKEAGEQPQGFARRGRVMMWPGQDPNASLAKLNGDWKYSSPVVQDGKVVFTAPDGNAVHCLNVRDGDPIWQAERRDDLYLAGVFNGKVVLVGKNSCRALSLADGKKQIWQTDTGVPSGMGVASGSSYYLPLRKGEICKIDLERGTLTRSPVPKNDRGEAEAPGNLLFYNGDVVSQTETAVTCYPQVEYKVAQISGVLKKNPNDPVALSERGELRLYQGDLAGAVADLHDAVQHQPPAAMVPKIRTKLYITLTELLKNDFPAASQYLAEYKELCKVPIPEGATTEERQKLESEQRRRQAGYLCLFAEGREKQGRLLDAFQAYLEYGALAEAKELVPVINESSVRTQPDLWAQGRIAAMMAKATPEQRKPLEDEIARRWKLVQEDKNHEALRRFVAAFGSLSSVGREARLKLAERLIEQNAYLDAELQLEQLSLQRDELPVAGRGVETLARMWARRGLMDDASHYYRILGRDFAKVVIRDGKTGAELLMELASDKRFWPYLDDMIPPLTGPTVNVMEIRQDQPLLTSFLPFEARTDLLPSFHRLTLASSQSNINQMNSFQLKLLDRDSNEPLWTIASAATRAQYMPYGNSKRFPFYAKGHLVVLYLGHTVFAVDLIERKKLWDRDLINPDRLNSEQPWQMATLTLDNEGALHITSPTTGTIEKIGQIGPVTASYVCLRTQDGLTALDPVRGNVLWTKTDLSAHTQVFGDDNHVFLVEVRDDQRVGTTRAIRGMDGVAVDVPDFAAAFQRRLPRGMLGGKLLVSENDPTGSLVLRLYDIASGQDLYKTMLAPDAIVLKTEEADLTGVVEANGKVRVIDLAAHKEIFHAAVATEHLEKVTDGLLLQDDRNFYVILNKPNDATQGVLGPYSNLTMLRSERVNGEVYAFDRHTGKVNWHNPVEHQMVLLEQFQDLPMMLFTAKYTKVDGRGLQRQTTGTRSIDKRTGKRIYPRAGDLSDPDSGVMPLQSQGPFHTLRIDRQNGVVDLIANKMRLRHYVGNNGMTGLNGSTAPAINWDAQPRPVPLQPMRPMRPMRPRLGGDGN